MAHSLWETQKLAGPDEDRNDEEVHGRPPGHARLDGAQTLDVLGPLHGYGLARRIEQISGDRLTLNAGTLYPLLLKLEQEGAITSERGPSETTGARASTS